MDVRSSRILTEASDPPDLGSIRGSQFICTVSISDLLVGVEHHSEGGSHCTWRKVLAELSSNHAAVSVATHDLAPSALVCVTCL